MLPTNSTLATQDRMEPVSVGDQGLMKWYSNYMNDRTFSAYKYGAGRNQRRDHFRLEDNENMMEELGTVIRTVNVERFSFINTELLPYRETDQLEQEITILNVGDVNFLEMTPAEAASRYLSIKKDKVQITMKRFGIGAYFEVDRMMTGEGLADYALFMSKIAEAYMTHGALLGLSKLMRAHDSERRWYSQFKAPNESLTETELQREVAEFGQAHKADAGVFELIWKYAKAMQYANGVPPDFVIFNSEKQSMFKFGNKMLSEYYRAGPNGPKRILGYEELGYIQGMSYRAMPSFSADTTDDGKELSLASQDAQIGNKYVMRRSVFLNYGDKFKNGVHNYLDLWSEQKDGMHRLWEREMLLHSGRFDPETGYLHGDHDALINNSRHLGSNVTDLDIFVFHDRDSHHYRKCLFLGDMEPRYLNRDVLRANVNKMKALPGVAPMLNGGLDGKVRVLQSDNPLASADAQNTLYAMVRALSDRLGGVRNPGFDHRRFKEGNLNDDNVVTRTVGIFLNVCGLFQDPFVQHTDKDLKNRFHLPIEKREEVWSKVRSVIAKDEPELRKSEGESKYKTIEHLILHLENFYARAPTNDDVEDTFRHVRIMADALLVCIADEDYQADMDQMAASVKLFDELNEKGFFESWNSELITKNLKTRMTNIRLAIQPATKDKVVTPDIDYEDDDMVKGAHVGIKGPKRMSMGVKSRNLVPDSTRVAPAKLKSSFFSFNRRWYAGADGDDDEYMVGRGMFAGTSDTTATYSSQGTTMMANVTWVMDTYVDVMERAIALAMLLTPLHYETLDGMLANDLHVPFDYILLRPFMDYLMSNILLASGGRKLGETLVGFGHVGLGSKVINKTMDLSTTQWLSAAIYDYARRCVIRYAFYERAYGGAGHVFFTDAEYEEFVDNGFHMEGLDRPSLLSGIIPMDSFVKEDYVSLFGFLPGFMDKGRAHYASYRYYGIRYKFNGIMEPQASLIQDVTRQKTNVVCWQGTQRQCGNVNGDPGETTENKGHHGIERNGDRDVRNRGLRVKQMIASN